MAAVLAAPAPTAGGNSPALRRVSIAFDTSARSSPTVGPFPVSVVVEGLLGGNRVALADGIDLEVERDVSAPAVFELTLRDPIDRDELDQVVTTLSTNGSAPGRWIFHYTLTLGFEAPGADGIFRQKVYAVTLGAASPLAMTQTSARRLPPPTGDAAPGADTANTIERAYTELEANYALLENVIEGNRQDVQPPIWTHYVLGSLALDGDRAVMTVRHAFSRMQLVAGKLRKVETSVTRDETWVRMPQGWKRRSIEKEQDAEWYVDGKRIEPGKPYHEAAPPFEPPPWTPPP